MKLAELFIDIKVPNFPAVAAALRGISTAFRGVAQAAGGGKGGLLGQLTGAGGGVPGFTKEMQKIIGEMARVRRPFTQMQRALNQIGGEMTQGLQLTGTAMKRAVSREMEPQMVRLQSLMARQVAQMRGLGPAGTRAFEWAIKSSTAIGKFQFGLARVQEGLGPFLGMATRGFYALTGATVGWVTAGLRGTQEGAYLAQIFARISREVAGIFMPAVQRLTDWMLKLLGKMEQLTGAQQDQIFGWVKMAAGVLGFGLVADKALKVTSAMAGAMQGLIALGIELNVVTGGLFIVIGGLVAGMAAWAVGTQAGREQMVRLGKAVLGLVDRLKELGLRLLARLGPTLSSLFKKITDLVIWLAEAIANIPDATLDQIADTFKTIGEALKLAVDLTKGWLAVMGEVLKVATRINDALPGGKGKNKLLGLATGDVGTIWGIVKAGLGRLGLGPRGAAGLAPEDEGIAGQVAAGGLKAIDPSQHRTPTPAGGGFEALQDTWKRFATAAQKAGAKTDEKRTADGVEELVGMVKKAVMGAFGIPDEQPGLQMAN